ncbi:hypothetical protein KKE60_04520 [Patescibacteria group bacterium]|nr:hypothetical protein [Patescibacteria group bacterium]
MPAINISVPNDLYMEMMNKKLSPSKAAQFGIRQTLSGKADLAEEHSKLLLQFNKVVKERDAALDHVERLKDNLAFERKQNNNKGGKKDAKHK